MPMRFETVPRSMGEWMFADDTWLGKLATYGAIGLITGMILAALMEHFIHDLPEISPTDWVQVAVCFFVTAFLAVPVVAGIQPRDPRLRRPVILTTTAYFLIALFYLVPDAIISAGSLKIDAKVISTLLDFITSFFFISVWLSFSDSGQGRGVQISERLVAVLLLILLFVCAIWKIKTQLTGNELDLQACRHVLNFLNGVVLLGLYAQMLRLLLPPDPVNGLIILLYACAQIVADLRDCINLKGPAFCEWSSPHGFEAHGTAIILLIGKLSYGLYFIYSFYEGGFRSQIQEGLN